jgi:DNA-binding transcriptional regulator YiaG
MRCSKCELERRSPDQVEGDYLATMAAIRETHGLLTHQEIRRTREALGVTPDEFDQLLGLPSGISKGWETQRHLQNRAADARIRALQDVEHAKGVAVGARVTLRLTEEERAAYKPPAFLRKKGAAAISAEALEETPGGRGRALRRPCATRRSWRCRCSRWPTWHRSRCRTWRPTDVAAAPSRGLTPPTAPRASPPSTPRWPAGSPRRARRGARDAPTGAQR